MTILLITALLPLPITAADGAGTGGHVICDVSFAPTKCAATFAAAVTGCATISFQGFFGQEIEGQGCVQMAGAAGATAIIHIPVGFHDIEAVSSDERNECHDRYAQVTEVGGGGLLGSSACQAAAEVSGCGKWAKVTSIATNFNSLPARSAFAATEACPIPPPPPPPPFIYPCSPTCSEIDTLPVPDLVEDLPEPILCHPTIQNNMPPIIEEIIAAVIEHLPQNNCPSYTIRLGDLDEESQRLIRSQVTSSFLLQFEEESAGWPDEPLHALLKATMRESIIKASYLGDDAVGVFSS